MIDDSNQKYMEIENALKECSSRLEFVTKYNHLYCYAKKHKLLLSKYYALPRSNNLKRGSKYTKEQLHKEALTYNTRYEFKQKNGNYYEAARRLGFLDEICNHMLRPTQSFPQMACHQLFDKLFSQKGKYNDRTIIKPYELDIYYPEFNIAIEVQGYWWHSAEKAKIRDDRKMDLCKQKNILLIAIHEKWSHNHTKQILHFKEQVKHQLKYINLHCKTVFSEQDIDNIIIDTDLIYATYSLDHIKLVISKYDSLKDFSLHEPGVYDTVRRLNRLDLIEHFRERKYPIKWKNMTDDEIFNHIIKDYTTFSSFSNNEIYRTIMRRRKLTDKVKNYFRNL